MCWVSYKQCQTLRELKYVFCTVNRSIEKLSVKSVTLATLQIHIFGVFKKLPELENNLVGVVNGIAMSPEICRPWLTSRWSELTENIGRKIVFCTWIQRDKVIPAGTIHICLKIRLRDFHHSFWYNVTAKLIGNHRRIWYDRHQVKWSIAVDITQCTCSLENIQIFLLIYHHRSEYGKKNICFFSSESAIDIFDDNMTTYLCS